MAKTSIPMEIVKLTEMGTNGEMLRALKAHEAAQAAQAEHEAMDPGPTRMGAMTITFWDHGSNNITPEVTFDPVGRITPNSIERNLPYIYHQINLRQTQQRNGQ
jgi:hypothetical protein